MIAVGVSGCLILAACGGGDDDSDSAAAPSAGASSGVAAPETEVETEAPEAATTPEAAAAPAATPADASAAPSAAAPAPQQAAAPKQAKAAPAAAGAAGQAPAPKQAQAAPAAAAPAPKPAPAAPGGGAAAPQPGAEKAGGEIPPPPDVKVPADKEKQGVTDTEIRVGAQGAYDGPAEFPTAFTAPQAYLRMINEQGGVNGRKFKYTFYSDASVDSNRGMDNARRLEEQDKIFALVGGMAWHSGDVTGPYHQKNGTPWVGDSGENYHPHTLGVGFPSGVNVAARMRPAASHWIKTDPRFKKSAIFRVNTYLSDDGGNGFKAAIEKGGGEIVYNTMQPFGYPDYTGEILTAKSRGATALFCICDTGTFLRLVQAAQRQGWRPAFSSGEWGYSKNKLKSMGAFVDGTLLAGEQVGFDDPVPEMQRMREQLQKSTGSDELDQGAPHTWAATRMFVEGIKALGNDITRTRIMGWLAAQRNFDTLGLTVPFDMSYVDRKGNKFMEKLGWKRESLRQGRSLTLTEGGTKHVSHSDWINIGDNFGDPMWRDW